MASRLTMPSGDGLGALLSAGPPSPPPEEEPAGGLRMMPQSPSSLKLFLECPFRYMGRYVKGWYRFEGNRYTERGNVLHRCMEEEALGREASWPAGEGAARDYGRRVLASLRLDALRAAGWTVAPEHEAAVDAYGSPSDWNSRSAFLRSRIDLCLVSPDGERAVLVDWKTGKTPGDPVQLQVNALTLAGLCRDRGRRFLLLFVYLDQARIERRECGRPDVIFPVTEAAVHRARAREAAMRRSWEGLIGCIEAHRTGRFPRTPGAGCRWCEIRDRCGDGRP